MTDREAGLVRRVPRDAQWEARSAGWGCCRGTGSGRSRWVFEGFSFWTCGSGMRPDGWTELDSSHAIFEPRTLPRRRNACWCQEATTPTRQLGRRTRPHHTTLQPQRTIESAIICPARLGRCWSLRQAYLRLDFENRALEGERGGSDSERRGRPPACFDKRRGDGRAWTRDAGRWEDPGDVGPAPMPSPVLAPRTSRCQCPNRASRTRRLDLIRVHSFRDTASVYPPSPLPAASRVPTTPSPDHPALMR